MNSPAIKQESDIFVRKRHYKKGDEEFTEDIACSGAPARTMADAQAYRDKKEADSRWLWVICAVVLPALMKYGPKIKKIFSNTSPTPAPSK